MIVTAFDPAHELIVVTATIWGPQGSFREVRLAVDTGSTETLLMPQVTDTLGYSARAGEAITVIRTAIGKEQGYLLRVAKFSALGYDLLDFRVHVHDLPDGFGIEGLVGLSFLRNFDYEVRSTLGQLRVDRASSLA
jgi:aspartyl protease family protein